MKTINVGRTGVFNGLFGNPVREKKVSPQYRQHFRKVMKENPKQTEWLQNQLDCGNKLFCPGCGIGSPTCHARIIEEELGLASY